MTEKITITDELENSIFELSVCENKISIKNLFLELSTLITKYINETNTVRYKIENLETDLKDLKEAFEHNDDSLSRLRTDIELIKLKIPKS